MVETAEVTAEGAVTVVSLRDAVIVVSLRDVIVSAQFINFHHTRRDAGHVVGKLFAPVELGNGSELLQGPAKHETNKLLWAFQNCIYSDDADILIPMMKNH